MKAAAAGDVTYQKLFASRRTSVSMLRKHAFVCLQA